MKHRGPREGPKWLPQAQWWAQGPCAPLWGSEILREALSRADRKTGQKGHGGKTARGRASVRGAPTSIVEQPVDVNGLLALLRLEDGAGLLLPHQGLRVHCRSRGPVTKAQSTVKGLSLSANSRLPWEVDWLSWGLCTLLRACMRVKGVAQSTTNGPSDSKTLICPSQIPAACPSLLHCRFPASPGTGTGTGMGAGTEGEPCLSSDISAWPEPWGGGTHGPQNPLGGFP